MLVTAGHRDTVDHGRVWRPFDENLYDPTWERPHQARPIVERRLPPRGPRADARERRRPARRSTRTRPAASSSSSSAKGSRPSASASSTPTSTPTTSSACARSSPRSLPDAYVQTSRDLAAGARVRAHLRRHARRLHRPAGRQLPASGWRSACEEAGFDSRVEIMQMDGGLRTIESVRERAGLHAAVRARSPACSAPRPTRASCSTARNLVCLDIGGTSSDLGVILDGSAEVTNEWELEHAIPLAVTTLDVRSIGAGGGSLISSRRGRLAAGRARVRRLRPGARLLRPRRHRSRR